MIDKKKKDLIKREKIKNYVLLSSVIIVPLLFFLWVGYISISSVGANLNMILNLSNEETTKIISLLNNTWHVFKIMSYEYIIYSFLLILNYIFYKKKHKLLLLVINSVILIVFIIDFIINFIQNGSFYNYDLLIFVISSLIGLYYAYKLNKELKN